MAGANELAKYPLEEILFKYSPETLSSAFSNIGLIELSKGCSIGCDFCGAGAQKGVKSQMSFSQIELIAGKFKHELFESQPFLYGASDPLDWCETGKSYLDVSDLFESEVGYKPFVSTSIPVGKEELALEMLLMGKIELVTISHMNFRRLKKFFTGKFPKLEHSDFRITESSGLKSVEFTGDPPQDKVENWIYLVFCVQDSNKHLPGDRILTLNGRPDSDRYLKLGDRNVSSLSLRGIGCFHGVILNSEGLFNERIIAPSKKYPYGIINERINQANPIIWDKWNLPMEFPALLPHTKDFPFSQFMDSLIPEPSAIFPINTSKELPYRIPLHYCPVRPDQLALQALAYEISARKSDDLVSASLAKDLFGHIFERYVAKTDYSFGPYSRRIDKYLKRANELRKADLESGRKMWNFEIIEGQFRLV